MQRGSWTSRDHGVVSPVEDPGTGPCGCVAVGMGTAPDTSCPCGINMLLAFVYLYFYNAYPG